MATRYGLGHIFTSNTKDAILINVWFSQKERTKTNYIFIVFTKMQFVLSVPNGMPVPLTTEGILFKFERSIAFDNILHFGRCDVILGY